ncbi:MAG: hypothetical protein RIS76_4236 [Verrucomicrobiota bacterium]|jgi:hypothetical protein
MSTLGTEITKFRQWAVIRLSPDYRPGPDSHGAEWECDYPDWHDIYCAVTCFLASAHDRALTSHETELMLYALARDNEDEIILETLVKFPVPALQVAEAALTYPDSDARWQMAVLLGRIGTLNAVALLGRFLADQEEYVRRRARFALQEANAK